MQTHRTNRDTTVVRPSINILTKFGWSSKLFSSSSAGLTGTKDVRHDSESAPSRVYSYRAKASKYAVLPSNNDSCLNDI